MARTTFRGPVRSLNGFEGAISGVLTGVTSLTDNSGGVASNTLAAAAGAAPTAEEFENAVASLAAKINEIIAALD